MRKSKQPCCGTCKFAEFHLQKNGRINRLYPGMCLFNPVMPPLPVSITKAYGYREFSKSYITHDTTDCPTYEPAGRAKQ